MRAAVVRAFGSLEVVEWPEPQPGAQDAVIDISVIEINYPDLLVIDGRYQFKPPLPFVPGKSAVGRVSAVGSAVTHLAVGQRVAVQVEYGAYTEKLCARAANCFPIPDALDDATAAALGLPYQTAWFALRERAGFAAGQSVLALGASGGVGLATVQLARAFGAGVVVGSTRGPERAALVRQAGADLVVETSRADLRDALRDETRAATGGRGIDIAVDPIGGAATEAALRALAWCGRLVVVGFAAGDVPIVKANYLLVKNIAAIGLQWSDYRDRAPDLVARAQDEIFALAVAGRLAPAIDAMLPLAEIVAGLRKVSDGTATGRVLLRTGR
jgi:NADPH2:quinone reductase